MKPLRILAAALAVTALLTGCDIAPKNTDPVISSESTEMETQGTTQFPGTESTENTETTATEVTVPDASVPVVTVPTVPEPTVTVPPETVPETVPATEPAPPATEPPHTEHIHRWGAWETEAAPGCESAGTRLRTCADCGEDQKESVSPTGHKWDGGTEKPSGSACGGDEKVYTCQHCGKTKSETLPAVHTFSDWTYEEYTYTIYYEPDSLEYVHGGPSSTHTSHRKIRTCTGCGFVEKGDTPDHSCQRGSVNHTVTKVREVTCLQRGLKRSTCKICGWYEEYEYGNGDQGHAWISEERHLTDYTETTDELDVEILTCTVCGQIQYYYRWGVGPCICGRTPCVAEGNWRGCKSVCRSAYMYGGYDVGIESRGEVFNVDTQRFEPIGDSYRVNDSDNPDGYITHPTWQSVTRDYVFNEEGLIIQYTVFWYDESGNRFSDIVYVPDIPQMFLDAGCDPELVNYPYAHFHLTLHCGKIVPSRITYSG